MLSLWTMLIPMALMIAGLIVTLFTIYQKGENDRFMEQAVSVYATCTKVWSEKAGVDNTEKNYAGVMYDYAGAVYYAERVIVPEKTYVGDIITVYINPENPEELRQKYQEQDINGFIFIGAALIILSLLLSSVVLIRRRKAAERIRMDFARHGHPDIVKNSAVDVRMTYGSYTNERESKK